MKKTFLLILILFFSISESFACICGRNIESFSKQVKRDYNQSDLIFTGKVVEIISINENELKSSADPIIYKFEILKIIKGKFQKQIIKIASESSEISCGYKFELEKTYLVYSLKPKTLSKTLSKKIKFSKTTRFPNLNKNEFDFATGLCSGNKILNKVKQKELRKLKRLSLKNSK